MRLTYVGVSINELCLCGSVQEVLNSSLFRGLIQALWTTSVITADLKQNMCSK